MYSVYELYYIHLFRGSCHYHYKLSLRIVKAVPVFFWMLLGELFVDSSRMSREKNDLR